MSGANKGGNMSIDRHKQIIREHFALMDQGDYLGALKDFADDMTWWVIGPPAMNGGSHNKEYLVEVYRTQVPQFFPNGIKATLIHLIAEGDWVAVEGRSLVGNATGIGKHYSNTYMWLFEFREEKVVTFKEYYDTLHAREAIFGA
jgi:ketosteroid isomerase-like protein